MQRTLRQMLRKCQIKLNKGMSRQQECHMDKGGEALVFSLKQVDPAC